MKLLRIGRFLGIGFLLVGVSAWAIGTVDGLGPEGCTAFVGSGPSGVFVGSNKDGNDPMFRLCFVPAAGDRYGCFLFVSSGIVGGGMNEHGLVVDQLTLPNVEVAGDPTKPIYSGSWPILALETCRTVADALALYETYSLPGTWQTKIFLADATGDAAIIEGDAIIRKTSRYLVTTNFIQSRTPPEDIDCDRFLTASSMLEEANTYDAALFARIAHAVHQEYAGGGGTAFSTIFDLTQRRITCYLYYDFQHGVSFDLSTELAKGEHSVDIAELLPNNAPYSKWRAERLEELRRRVAALAEHSGTEAIPTDIVGSYEFNPSSGFVTVAPHYIMTFAIVVSDGHLGCVFSPEGDTVEFYSAGSGAYANLPLAESMLQIAIRFTRDAAGQVTGGTLSLGDGRMTTFSRTSEEPCYQPVDHFWIDLPTAPDRESAGGSLTWIGLALVGAGLIALLFALLW